MVLRPVTVLAMRIVPSTASEPVLQKAAVGIATDLASLLEREGVTRFH